MIKHPSIRVKRVAALIRSDERNPQESRLVGLGCPIEQAKAAQLVGTEAFKAMRHRLGSLSVKPLTEEPDGDLGHLRLDRGFQTSHHQCLAALLQWKAKTQH